MARKRTIMIVAGEASGDGHAAKVIRALREQEPGTEFEFLGAAGPKMRNAGAEAIVESDGLSIVGLAEIGRALPMFLRAKRDLKEAAVARRPDVVVLVDFPDFNLKLAKSLKKLGLPIVYYISPQLWAWRGYRVATVRKYVDLMITILPFEKDWYEKKGVTHVEYVGSPLANEVHTTKSRQEFCSDHGLDAEPPIIALLPGSRHKEIVRILPVMLQAIDHVKEKLAGVQFLIAAGSMEATVDIEAVRSAKPVGSGDVRVITGETYDVLGASDAAAVTSGTATLEAGIIGTPMAIVYKTSALNYSLLEPLISVDHYGLINLIAGERLATELIQKDFTGDTLSAELVRLLEPDTNAKMRHQLRDAAAKLGQGGASMRAAKAILRLIDSN